MRKTFLVGCLILLLCLPSPAFGGTSDNVAKTYHQIYRCLVRVIYSYEYMDMCGEIVSGTGSGSGVLININGENKIVTCYHVIGQKPIGSIMVYIPGGETTYTPTVEIEKYNTRYDLLILSIKSDGPPWSGVKVASSIDWGEKIYFGGYSAFPLPRIRIGFLVFNAKNGIYLDPIYFGDSGGGVFNADGELIGIIYRTYLFNKTPTLTGYAIPVTMILGLLE